MASSNVSAQQERRAGAQAQVVPVAYALRIVAATDPGTYTEPDRAAQAWLGDLVGRERELNVPAQVETGVMLHPLAQSRPCGAAGQEVVIAGERQRAERDAVAP